MFDALPPSALRRVPAELRAKIKVVRRADGRTCWERQGKLNDDGYSLIYWNGKWHYGHRLFYKLIKGPIPKGHELHHTCRVRKCVNPACMKPLTPRVHRIVTLLDMVKRRRGRS
jgi:hypothetical protein